MSTPVDPEPLIRLRGLVKTYGSGALAFQALKGIDLDVLPGEFIAVMGPSGSGKSTAMNLIGCLDTPSAGHYRFRGVAVEGLDRDQRALLRRRHLGFVFQGPIVRRNDKISSSLKNADFFGLTCNHRNGLNARRARSNHADTLASQINTFARPCAGVIDGAFKIFNARQVGQTRH